MMDIVEDEFNGLLVKPADSGAFATAVERLMNSPELRRELGRAAQETMKRHTWDQVAKKMERVFALAITDRKRE
jgi:glycosyltransferase involved in cell wall biosynthesis